MWIGTVTVMYICEHGAAVAAVSNQPNRLPRPSDLIWTEHHDTVKKRLKKNNKKPVAG